MMDFRAHNALAFSISFMVTFLLSLLVIFIYSHLRKTNLRKERSEEDTSTMDPNGFSRQLNSLDDDMDYDAIGNGNGYGNGYVNP